MTRYRPLPMSSGFTLIEVVISLTILAMALMWILLDQSIAVKRSVRARKYTQAVYLAKAKMQETEGLLRDENEVGGGFTDFEEENCGNFDDGLYEGAELFTYCVHIEKVMMPDITMMQQNIMGALGLGSQEEGAEGQPASPLSGLLEQFMPGMGQNNEMMDKMNEMAGQVLGPIMGMIQGVLEESIRRVTVKVFFFTGGTKREYELVAYFTDLNQMTNALFSPSSAGTSGTGTTGSTGSSGSSSSGGTK